MKWTYSVNPDKLPDGTGRLRFRVSFGRSRVAFNIGIRVELSKWNSEAQRSKPNVTHGHKKVPANYINREIQNYIDTAERLFLQYDTDGEAPTADSFKKDFNSALQRTPESSSTLAATLERFIRHQSTLQQWGDATIKRFEAVQNKLTLYGAKDTELSEVTTAWLESFVEWLTYSQKLSNSTVRDYLKRINWFLNWARVQGERVPNDYQTFAPRLRIIKPPVIALTWQELMTMYHAEMPAEYLDRVRDLFCLSSFTSLRYSDLQNLKPEDIKEDYIDIVTKKTSEPLRIELNTYSRAIIEKYDKHLPRLSNQKYNKYIKEVGQLCGIDEPIKKVDYIAGKRVETTQPKWRLLSTHAARRTFISNAIERGVPVPVVMKWSGHEDYKAMEPYITITDKTKREMMDMFTSRHENDSEI